MKQHLDKRVDFGRIGLPLLLFLCSACEISGNDIIWEKPGDAGNGRSSDDTDTENAGVSGASDTEGYGRTPGNGHGRSERYSC